MTLAGLPEISFAGISLYFLGTVRGGSHIVVRPVEQDVNDPAA
jgi:hypothetical protein